MGMTSHAVNPDSISSQQMLRLSVLLQLEQRARKASAKELNFLMLNETTLLVHYQQAALWLGDAVDGKLAGVSGTAEMDAGAPYIIWLKKLMAEMAKNPDIAIRAVVREELPTALAQEWKEWFPTQAIWCPLPFSGGKNGGCILLGRNDAWQDGEKQLLGLLFSGYGQCVELSHMQERSGRLQRYWIPRRRKLLRNSLLAFVLIACLPVRVSVLAPAEVAPLNPAPIRAPFDGVIAGVNVAPNSPVHAGQVLFTFETSELKAKNDMAAKALEMAKAQYAATAQEAMNDAQAKSHIATLESKIQQQQAELDYNSNQLVHAVVTAPIDGVAVFDDPVNWIGKPVSMGERVMLVAPPQANTLEIQVPVGEVVTFTPGAEVLFFSNISPASPVEGKLTFASYSSQMTPEGVLAYDFRATLKNSSDDLRLGLKGTAKIYGERKPLALWLLRRPIALIRQWLVL